MNRITLTIAHKISLLSLILIVATSAILGLFLIERSTSVLVDGTLDEIHRDMEDQGHKLIQHIFSIKEDVRVVARLGSLQNLLQAHNDEQRTIEHYRLAVINDFTAIMQAKPTYLHVRYIDAKGQEVVRVDRKRRGSEVHTIPKPALQNKLHRDYVQDTLSQGPGETYVSDIELYKEHGVLVEPHQIGSRVSMPLYNAEGNQLLGMVIINFEVGDFLEQMQGSHHKRDQQMFITNDLGDYLLHPDPAKRFGFMRGERFLLQDDVPETHRFFTQKEKPDGFRLMQKSAEQRYVYVVDSLNIDPTNPERYLILAVRQPYEGMVSEQRAVHQESLIWGFLMVLIGASVALIFARRLSAPLEQMTSVVDKYTHGDKTEIQLPTDRSDELGVLARSFRSMISRVEAGQQALKNLNVGLEKRVDERTQALRDSEALQKAILCSMSDAVLTTLANGKIKGVNHAAVTMFGAPKSAMVGAHVSRFFAEAKHSDEKLHLGYRADGSSFPAEVVISEGEYSDQPIYTAVIRDATERLAADKLKTEFVSTVSHELRTPLTAIKGTLELMAGNVLGELPDKAKPMLKIACNNANRLLVIINDLLDIQKIAEGKMRYEFKIMEIAPFLQKAMEHNQAYANQYKVTFEITANTAEGVNIYADENRMMQVLSNLLSNAAKFSPEGGHVELATTVENGLVCISVSDHGCGIPEAFQQRMFTKFSQADSSDTRTKGGSGLGLVVTKSIVEDHQGEINYTSQQGLGSTFFVRIPQQEKSE